MSLQDDIEYLKARIFALEDRVKTSPHFRWGTVVTSVPLTIILDGAADALPGTPANAGPKVLMAGERVRVELQGNRAVVHAVGGRANDIRGTSAQRVDLGLSGVVRDGMRFYDEDEKREYMWANGVFRAVDTGWVELTSSLNSTYRGTLQGRRDGASIELLFIASSASFANDAYVTVGTLPPEWRPAGTQTRRAPVWFDNAYMGFGYVIPSSGVIGIVHSTGSARAGAQANWMYTS